MQIFTKHHVVKLPFIAFLSSVIVLAGCTSISYFNQRAYENAISLKVESIYLMRKATESYSLHEESIRALKIDLDKAYEYARGIPKNEISTEQWRILCDTSRHLLGGFLKEWKEKGVLGATYVENKIEQVADAFDSISGLESGKRKQSDFTK